MKSIMVHSLVLNKEYFLFFKENFAQKFKKHFFLNFFMGSKCFFERKKKCSAY